MRIPIAPMDAIFLLICRTEVSFCACGGPRKLFLKYHFEKLLNGVGITDAKERKLQLYSCRHYGISKRVNNGANIVQLAKDCGTSMEHITKTYYHTNLRNSERNMAIMYEG